MLLQSLDKNRFSNTFYSTNCISNSEKSLGFNFNERESFNFENNFNAYSNFNYDYNTFNNNNNNNYNVIVKEIDNNDLDLNFIGKDHKKNSNLVNDINNVYHRIGKEEKKNFDLNFKNTNKSNNSSYSVNCKLSDEKETKITKFAIPFDDLKDKALNITIDDIIDKTKEININNNYNLEAKKQSNKVQELSARNHDKINREDLKKSCADKNLKRVLDKITKKLESGNDKF